MPPKVSTPHARVHGSSSKTTILSGTNILLPFIKMSGIFSSRACLVAACPCGTRASRLFVAVRKGRRVGALHDPHGPDAIGRHRPECVQLQFAHQRLRQGALRMRSLFITYKHIVSTMLFRLCQVIPHMEGCDSGDSLIRRKAASLLYTCLVGLHRKGFGHELLAFLVKWMDDDAPMIAFREPSAAAHLVPTSTRNVLSVNQPNLLRLLLSQIF